MQFIGDVLITDKNVRQQTEGLKIVCCAGTYSSGCNQIIIKHYGWLSMQAVQGQYRPWRNPKPLERSSGCNYTQGRPKLGHGWLHPSQPRQNCAQDDGEFYPNPYSPASVRALSTASRKTNPVYTTTYSFGMKVSEVRMRVNGLEHAILNSSTLSIH